MPAPACVPIDAVESQAIEPLRTPHALDFQKTAARGRQPSLRWSQRHTTLHNPRRVN